MPGLFSLQTLVNYLEDVLARVALNLTIWMSRMHRVRAGLEA